MSLQRAEQAEALVAGLQHAGLEDLRFDALSRVIYSTDASHYQIEPLGVACPRDADEVAAAVEVCATLGLPITARAGGSSLAGQAIGEGLVLDTSRHLKAMRLIPEAGLAIAEPGLVLDRLNREAARLGMMFGPDPASSDRACMGGIVANNSTGAHSIAYGMAVDHLRSADVVLSDGSRTRLRGDEHRQALDKRIPTGSREAKIYTALAGTIEAGGAVIARDFPRYWRRAGGYNLDRLLHTAAAGAGAGAGAAFPGPLNAVARLAGSEGTLAIATELELALVPRPANRGLLVVHFDQLHTAFEAVPSLLETEPTAIELVDRMLIRLARQAPGYAKDLVFVEGDPAALLLVEFCGERASQVDDALRRAERRLRRQGFDGPFVRATKAAEQASVWRARKAGLGLLARQRGDAKPVAGIEDSAVPPERLADYMADLRSLLDELGLEAAFYAHASAGCIHVRPVLDLKTNRGRETLDHLTEQVFRLVLQYGGVNSSEHGDGIARSGFNRRLFGPEIYRMFEDLKQAFDPLGILNPGKVVGPMPKPSQLRFAPDYAPEIPVARFVYREDGDLLRAVEQCNGAGVCRKLEPGSMCPSYMVTQEELDSTRGRANALRAALDGRLPEGGLGSDAVHEAMDLCVGCKACKTECPSGVDMARLKIETSAARAVSQGFRPRARLFAELHRLDRLMSHAPSVANALLRSTFAAAIAGRLGIHSAQGFPSLAPESLDRWWRRRGPRRPESPSHDRAVLFADTFSTFHEPHVGQAVVSLLEAAGLEVILPHRSCCGRPALSQGMVEVARRSLRANLRRLAPYARAGLPIVVPEPSCASVFRDEMPDLLTDPAEAADVSMLSAAVCSVEEWLAGLPAPALAYDPSPVRALLHAHCHQRALVGLETSVSALSRLPGLQLVESDAGCCGMAGAFGYEAEHYAVSLAMGERKLAPTLRALDAGDIVLASGTSCRQQIRRLTGRRAMHPAELLAAGLSRRRAASRQPLPSYHRP